MKFTLNYYKQCKPEQNVLWIKFAHTKFGCYWKHHIFVLEYYVQGVSLERKMRLPPAETGYSMRENP